MVFTLCPTIVTEFNPIQSQNPIEIIISTSRRTFRPPDFVLLARLRCNPVKIRQFFWNWAIFGKWCILLGFWYFWQQEWFRFKEETGTAEIEKNDASWWWFSQYFDIKLLPHSVPVFQRNIGRSNIFKKNCRWYVLKKQRFSKQSMPSSQHFQGNSH